MSEKDSDNGFRHLVRVADTDLKGSKNILYALTGIKGISIMLSNAFLTISGIPKDKKAGVLTDSEIAKLTEIVKNPTKYKIPVWMYNRRKDYESGEDKHILSTDLDFAVENDLKRLKKIRSYRGLRHAWGLPVRGQRTRSNFRKNKGKVTGVKKKSSKQ